MDTKVQNTVRSLRRFPTLYGLAWALFIAAIGTLIVSLWAHFGNLSDSHMVAAAYVIHCLAVICGGFTSSKCARERGWYHGALTGFIYAVLMTGIGIVVYNTFDMSAGGLFRALLMVLMGAFGGIMGVNSGNEK